MELILKKIDETPSSTLSQLLIDGQFFCFVLEDGHRAKKVAGETRIPAGTYPIVQRTMGNFFERYKKMWGHQFVPHIIGVPNFSLILIHAGNTVADTRGCPLVGDKPSRSGGNWTLGAGTSRPTYLRLYAALDAAFKKEEAVTIQIDRT